MDLNDRFVRGYLVKPRISSFPDMAGWKYWEIDSDYILTSHPKTEIIVRNFDDHFIAVIGRIYDCDNPSENASQICEKIFHLSKNLDTAPLLRYVAYLGGRFSILIRRKDEFIAIPDCAATYSLQYNSTQDGIYLASHWALVAEASGAKENEAILQFMRSPEYVEPGGKYYPGLWTPYEGVKTLIANHILKISSPEKKARQIRFYPFQEIGENSREISYADFERRLILNCALCLGDRNAFSLTGGGDSRATLAAYVAQSPPKPLHTFTYIRPQSPTLEQFEDVFKASHSAWKAGFQHLVIPVNSVDFSSDFHRWYSSSFPLGARYPSLARTYYENLVPDSTIIISTVAEIGTVFYKARDNSVPSPAALASKFTTSKIKSDSRLLSCMEDYMQETDFHAEHIFDFDWHDLFYWEHRNSKWASLWYAEVDMTGFAIVPYNDRRLLEIMLSLPFADREGKYLQKQMSRTWLQPLEP